MAKFIGFIKTLLGLPADPSELRAHRRLPLIYICTLEQDQAAHSAIIQNYSDGGVKIRIEGNPVIDATRLVYLKLHVNDHTTRIAFSIAWREDNYLGLQVSSWDEWIKVLMHFGTLD